MKWIFFETPYNNMPEAASRFRRVICFQRYVMKLRREHSYELGQMDNAVEALVYFDMPRECIVTEVGVQEVKAKTGYKKQHVTVILRITTDGQKPLSYVVKRKNKAKNVFLKVSRKECR